jgi:outer membrane autotransporter protein
MFKRYLYPALFIVSGHSMATDVDGFNSLQNKSETFVRSTCIGFVNDEKKTIARDENFIQTPNEKDLFNVCSAMLGSVQATKSGEIGVEIVAGDFQNLVPEETLTPMSIASNTSSLNTSSINSRLAKIRFGGGAGDDDLFSTAQLGFFINGMGGFGETEQTVEQNASDFETKGVIAGFDYKVTDNLIVGMAGSYSAFDLDFNNTINVAGGSVDSDNYTLTAYTHYSQDGGYVEGVFTYGWSEYDIDRKIVIGSNNVLGQGRSAYSSPEGEQFSATLSGGYDFHSGGLSYGPYARLSYFETQIDQYDETGAQGLNLRVDEHQADSLETVLGAQISYALSQSFGVLVPYAKAEWHHEFKNSQRSFGVRYVNDPRNNVNIYQSNSGNPDRNFFNISAGLSANLKHGFQTFINYETILGLSNIETHKFTAGIRMEF